MSNNRKGTPVRRVSFPVHYLLPVELRNNVHPVSLTPGIDKRDYDRIYIIRLDHHGTIRSWPTAEPWHLANPRGRHRLPSGLAGSCTSVTCTNTIASADLAL